jgi:hypothetical protein
MSSIISDVINEIVWVVLLILIFDYKEELLIESNFFLWYIFFIVILEITYVRRNIW